MHVESRRGTPLREHMIDHSRELLFLHIARTGGTSIETALVENDWWYIEAPTKHLSAKQARLYYGEKIWNTYTKFSVVRNPWDRVISMWSTKWWHPTRESREECSMEFFIQNLKPHPNETYNSLHYHEILNEEMDFVLRFENLQHDFSKMLISTGRDNISLPHMEKREHDHYRNIYSEKASQMVRKLFDKDISTFGYRF